MKELDYKTNISNFLIDYIEHYQLSFRKFSEITGVHRNSTRFIIKKTLSATSLETIEKYSKSLKIPIFDIIDYDRNKDYPFFK